MSLTRQIEIDWQGETYVVTPSNALLRQIEMGGVSLAGLASGFASGQPQTFIFAYVLSRYLQSAGAENVSEDEVNSVLERMPQDKVVTIMKTVIATIVPMSSALPGKPVARGTAKGAGKKRRAKQKARS
ncbi:MAG: hypothetical protein AAGI09_11890 [Pseudomonadota bacterium]